MININEVIKNNAPMTYKQIIETEIRNFKMSAHRTNMINGEKYYLGEHDILNRKRTVIGEGGILTEVTNLPNNKQIDNQYAKMVDQKTNYLLGKPITFKTENEVFQKELDKIFNKKFLRLMKSVGQDSLNGGCAWLHPYIDNKGDLKFRLFAPYTALPEWSDEAESEMDIFVRVYEVEEYIGTKLTIVEKVEVYSVNGIQRFRMTSGGLVEEGSTTHLTINDEPFNWERVPIIAFKANNRSTPLLNRVKSLQDGINTMLSDFENNMQEDARNTILVLKNYAGENLGEFRRNLATYGVVKIDTRDGIDGSLSTITVQFDSANYEAILEILKKSLIENARGFDAKDDRLSGNPNQMNIQSMYSDIDLDANGMETEFQASFEELLWFVKTYLSLKGVGDFENEEVEVIFNRDVLVNESETIDNCSKSVGILSDETIISQHPWVTDPKEELKRVKAQKKEAMEQYTDGFAPVTDDDDPANRSD